MMSKFRKAFESAERCIRPLLDARGFKLDEVSVTEKHGTQCVLGAAKYLEKTPWHSLFKEKRFIRISTAPLRLELDLDLGIGKSCYSIFELHELEGKKEFPARNHDLYKAMYDGDQLGAEFQRLVQVLEDCGERFFLNDPSLWEELNEKRATYHQERENKDAFRAAEIAFKNQDWDTVVRLLEEKYQFLGKLESRRLSYAKKKLNIT